MKISTSGNMNKVNDLYMFLITNLLPTTFPKEWFVQNKIGYLQAIRIFENGQVQFQFGRTGGLPENPEDDKLTLKPEILSNLCVDLKSDFDTIRCHRPSNFKDNALLGLWSSRRVEGDPIEVLLII